jgi:hypothetical protein
MEDGKIRLVFMTEEVNERAVFPIHTLMLMVETDSASASFKFNMNAKEIRF